MVSELQPHVVGFCIVAPAPHVGLLTIDLIFAAGVMIKEYGGVNEVPLPKLLPEVALKKLFLEVTAVKLF